MACNPPSYPPPSSGGGWGSSWGQGWSSGGSSGSSWSGSSCITIDYVVTPVLRIYYDVPVILGISYDVVYSSPLSIDYNIPPPLVIDYTVARPLSISYNTTYGFPLNITYSVSQPLTVDFTVLDTKPLDVSYSVPITQWLTISYDVGQNLTVGYTVPDAYKYLDVSFDVPGNIKVLSITYNVDTSYKMFVTYQVTPSTHYAVLDIWYPVDVSQKTSALDIYYSVSSPGQSDGALGEDIANGLVSLNISASEGSTNISATVLPTHPWSSASPGDVLSGYVAGKIFKFKVKSVQYDAVNCRYSISGSHNISDILGRVINKENRNIWAPDPVREYIESRGKICVGSLGIRNNVHRPTVRTAIYAAASAAGIDLQLDSNIPGLDDLVPFDQFYNSDELTVAEVINSLIGWAKPFYFLSGDKVIIVGGHPVTSSSPPATGNFNTRTESLYELPSSVQVNGGPWPKDPNEQTPVSSDAPTTVTHCYGEDESPIDYKEPSENDSFILYDHTTYDYPPIDDPKNAKSLIIGKDISRRVVKSGGRITYESETVTYRYLRPVVFDNKIVAFTPSIDIGEQTTITYTYSGACKDALVSKRTTTYRSLLSFLEGAVEYAAYENFRLSSSQLLYKDITETWGWSEKGYVKYHKKVSISLTSVMKKATTQDGSQSSFNNVGSLDVVPIYDMLISSERWLPLGDGLWYHSRSTTKKDSVSYSPTNAAGAVGWPLNHTTQENESEITDSGPQTSNCVQKTKKDQKRCVTHVICSKYTSSPGEGLTTYHETVATGGSGKSTSISVPGLNLYWPLPAAFVGGVTDSNSGGTIPGPSSNNTVPPMNLGQLYADYAAKARKESGRITANYIICSGSSGDALSETYVDTDMYLPGDMVNGGLVLSSSLTVDESGKVEGSYEAVYFVQ